VNALIIGGTGFLGPHIAEALLARGHSVTLFNRGMTDRSTRTDVEQVHGDRERDLGRLGNRTWDAVIDTSCYRPSTALTAARYFADRTDRYAFISTISVFDLAASDVITEESPIQLSPRDEYGPAKARCEAIVRSTFRHRATIVRPGLIVGPRDGTDRFTYWPVRIAEDLSPILAPVAPTEPAQFIDVRDLAHFTVRAIERRDGGTYNVTSPRGHFTMGQVIDTCKRVTGSRAEVVWASEEFLSENNVAPWMEMTLWVGQKSGVRSIVNADVRRAIASGLSIRPLEQTVRDTLEWVRTAHSTRDNLRAGLSREREQRLLATCSGPQD